MTRREKKEIVAGLVKLLSSIDYFYIVDSEGLNVEAVNDFRRQCFQAGVGYQVVKNTLIRKALEKLKSGIDYAAFNDQVLKGFSGILFSKATSSTPAKLIKYFRKQQSLAIPLFKGASIDNELFIGEEHLDTLSKLKSRTELVGELIGLLKSPITHVMASLQVGKHQLAGIVKALAERKQ